LQHTRLKTRVATPALKGEAFSCKHLPLNYLIAAHNALPPLPLHGLNSTSIYKETYK